MTADPRAALAKLTAALERHYEACASRREENDPAVQSAAYALRDAFWEYDEALEEAFDEVTPFVVEEPDDDDDLDEIDDDDDDDLELLDDLDDDDDDLDDEDDFEDDQPAGSGAPAGAPRGKA